MSTPCPLSRAGWPVWMALTQALIGVEWFKSGWSKWMSVQFNDGGMAVSLAKFAEKNPHEWYVLQVLKPAMASPELFAWMVKTGEVVAGAGLVLMAAFVVWQGWKSRPLKDWAWMNVPFLAIGVVMNLNFLYAAGWMSPSTEGLNVLMLWLQVLLMIGWGCYRSHEGKLAKA